MAQTGVWVDITACQRRTLVYINPLAPKFYFAQPVYKMQKYRTKKNYKINGILKRKTWRVCSIFLKNSVRIFLEKIKKWRFRKFFAVLYIGRTVPKG
jgi:hypothetical protein